MTQEGLGVLILAAGKGTRMHSNRPKVLQEMLEEPMLRYIYSALDAFFPGKIWTVIGHQFEMVKQAFPERQDAFWILQKEQLGTGHALQVSWDTLKAAGLEMLIVLNGDTPLITCELIQIFQSKAREAEADLAFLTLELDDPAAYGRVVRNSETGQVAAIVEAKDYDPDRWGPEPNEINAGIYCLKMEAVSHLLEKLNNDNKSGEYYITDLIALAVAEGLRVEGVCAGNEPRLMGINTPLELIEAEKFIQQGIVDDLLRSGCIIRSPESVRIGPGVHLDKGVNLTGPCEIYGCSSVESGAVIESHTVIRDSIVKSGAIIKSFSMLERATVGEDCRVGPYGRLRPDAVLEEGAQVGNFVEIKKSVLGPGVKANHLTYIGDAHIGGHTNIGAGTITCNYDGKNKHRTVIGENSFIGSNTAFVAPVTVGEGVLVGAGSVITEDVPDGRLAVARARQTNLKRSKS